MRLLNQISFIIAAALLTLPLNAQAEQQSPFKGGMKSISITKNQSSAEKPAEELPRKKVVFVQPSSATTHELKRKEIGPAEIHTEAEKDAAEAEDPRNKVWDKYKALAAGKTDENPEDAKQDSSEKKGNAEQQDDPKPSGFSAILQRYEQNKIRQSQMHTINLAPPPETPAPKTEASSDQPKTGTDEPKEKDKPEN